MAPGKASVDSEFMLNTEDVRILKIQEIRSTPIGVQFLLLNLKPDPWRVAVAFRKIVDRTYIAVRSGIGIRDRVAQVVCECRNSAQARQKIAEKGDASGNRLIAHDAGLSKNDISSGVILFPDRVIVLGLKSTDGFRLRDVFRCYVFVRVLGWKSPIRWTRQTREGI